MEFLLLVFELQGILQLVFVLLEFELQELLHQVFVWYEFELEQEFLELVFELMEIVQEFE